MTHIEHQEVRIRHIRSRNLTKHKSSASYEEVAVSEAFPEHIGLFVMNHSGDPAVNV
jgi:hypothetical protein